MRSTAISQMSQTTALVAGCTWAGISAPWLIAILVVHVIVIRVFDPILEAVGQTRAALIRRRAAEGRHFIHSVDPDG